MKKGYLVVVLFIFLLGLLFGCTQNISEEQALKDINLLQPITASQAHLVCNEHSCIESEVTIVGEVMRNSTSHGIYFLTDGEKNVYLRLRDLNESNKIIFEKDNYLLLGGIVEAKINGIIRHDKGMCTMTSCQDVVEMFIESSDFEFIKKVRCPDNKTAKVVLGVQDCFDFNN